MFLPVIKEVDIFIVYQNNFGTFFVQEDLCHPNDPSILCFKWNKKKKDKRESENPRIMVERSEEKRKKKEKKYGGVIIYEVSWLNYTQRDEEGKK